MCLKRSWTFRRLGDTSEEAAWPTLRHEHMSGCAVYWFAFLATSMCIWCHIPSKELMKTREAGSESLLRHRMVGIFKSYSSRADQDIEIILSVSFGPYISLKGPTKQQGCTVLLVEVLQIYCLGHCPRRLKATWDVVTAVQHTGGWYCVLDGAEHCLIPLSMSFERWVQGQYAKRTLMNIIDYRIWPKNVLVLYSSQKHRLILLKTTITFTKDFCRCWCISKSV
jgi:hypothetical protein